MKQFELLLASLEILLTEFQSKRSKTESSNDIVVTVLANFSLQRLHRNKPFQEALVIEVHKITAS